MRKRYISGVIAGAALALMSPTLRAQSVLVSDDLLGSSALAGGAPDIAGSGTWTTYYYDNGGEVVPASQNDTTGGGFSPLTGGTVAGANLAVDPVRSGSGVNVGASTSHQDDGAYIGFTAAPIGLITGTDTFSFSNIATSGNPTAWGFLALLTGAFGTGSATPDVDSNGTTEAFVGPWALVRPKSNGSDVIEIYATGGTSHQVTTTNTETNATGAGLPHTIQLQFDPVAGTLDATVDGVELLSTPYSYSAHSVAVPTLDGVEFGNRTNTGSATNAAPSTTQFTGVSVTQAVPEPASLGILSLGGIVALRRRRRH